MVGIALVPPSGGVSPPPAPTVLTIPVVNAAAVGGVTQYTSGTFSSTGNVITTTQTVGGVGRAMGYVFVSGDLGSPVVVSQSATNGGGSSGLAVSTSFNVTAAPTLSTFVDVAFEGSANTVGYVGVPFKQGELPNGSGVQVNGSPAQLVPLGFWDDGSVFRAMVVAEDTLNATPKRWNITAGAGATGPNVLESAITDNVSWAITGSATETITLASMVGTSALVKTRFSGPLMSEFKYIRPIGGDAHLKLVVSVRKFSNGQCAIDWGIENGNFLVAAPTDKTYSVVLSINGSTRDTITSLLHYSHTRPNYGSHIWVDADREFVPAHDLAYAKASRALPNFVGSSTGYASKVSTYSAYSKGEFVTPMTSTGFMRPLGVVASWDGDYLRNGRAVDWKSMLANSRRFGNYAFHFRDEATGDPVNTQTYWEYGGRVASGNVGGVPGAILTTPSVTGAVVSIDGVTGVYDPSHQPAPPYCAALFSARECFEEECQFMHAFDVLNSAIGEKTSIGGQGFNGSTRKQAWSVRTAVLASVISPPGVWRDCARDGYMRYLEWLHASWVVGSRANNLGVWMMYSGGGTSTSPYVTNDGGWDDAPWMMGYLPASMGFASFLPLGLSAGEKITFDGVRDHAFKLAIGLSGGVSDGWKINRAGPYRYSVSTVESSINPVFHADFAASYAAYLALFPALIAGSGADGGIFYNNEENSPAVDDSFKADYFWMHFQSLVYAKQLGNSAAAVNLARWRTMTNWVSHVAGAAQSDGLHLIEEVS